MSKYPAIPSPCQPSPAQPQPSSPRPKERPRHHLSGLARTHFRIPLLCAPCCVAQLLCLVQPFLPVVRFPGEGLFSLPLCPSRPSLLLSCPFPLPPPRLFYFASPLPCRGVIATLLWFVYSRLLWSRSFEPVARVLTIPVNTEPFSLFAGSSLFDDLIFSFLGHSASGIAILSSHASAPVHRRQYADTPQLSRGLLGLRGLGCIP